MKDKLSDLHHHLFAQLERLNDEALIGEDLNEEIARSKAISKISGNIIMNANLVLKAEIAMQESGIRGNVPGLTGPDGLEAQRS